MSLAHFIRDEQGATSIEYALIASLISIGIITGVTYFANNMEILFGTVSNSIDNAIK